MNTKNEFSAGYLVRRKRRRSVRYTMALIFILFVANLNAVIDLIFHPEVEYFHPEHIVVGLASALVTGIMLAVIIAYIERAEKNIQSNKHIEEALRESEDKFKAQYKGIPIPTYTWQITGDDLILVDYNDSAFGFTQGQVVNLIGKTATATYRDDPETLNELIECSHTKKNFRNERWYRLNSLGVQKYLAIHYAFIPPNLVMVHTEDVTGRKQADEALLKFKLGIERSADAVFITDPQGVITYANPAFEKIYGYAQADAIGHTPNILKSGVVPAEQYKLFWATLLSKNVVSGEIINKTKEGRLITVECSNNPILDETDTIIGFIGVHRDVSDRKRAETHTRVIAEMQDVLLRPCELEDIYRLVSEKVKELIGDGMTLTTILDEKRKTSRVIAHHGVDIPFEKLLAVVGFDPWQREFPLDVVTEEDLNIYRNSRLVAMEGGMYALTARFIPKPACLVIEKLLRVQKIYVMGFVHKEIHLGGLVILARSDITPHIPAIEQIVNLATIAIERKRAEEEVKSNEKRFHALIAHGQDNISMLTEDGTLLWDSPAVHSSLGYAQNQFVGENIFKLIHPDDQAWTSAVYAQVVQTPGNIQKGEFRLRHADGTWRWIECFATNLLEEPSVQAIVINYRDITMRKHAEEALAKSQNLLAETEKIGKVGGWEFDIDTLEQTWTEEVYRIHEVDLTYKPTVEEGINFYTPASMPIMEQAVRRAIEHGEPFDVELEIVTAKGNLRLVHAIGKADLEHRRVFGFFQDITEGKQAEITLKESEIRYRTLFEQASDGIFYLSTDGNVLAVNESFARMHGYSVEEMQGMNLQDLDTPETIQGLPERMRRIMAGEVIEFEAEHYHRDGHIVSLAVSTGLITINGRNIIQAFHRDITERKRVAEETALKNKQLTMLNNLGQALNQFAASLPEIVEKISNLIGQVFDNRNLYVALYDEATNLVSFPIYWMAGERRHSMESRPLSNGLTEFVIRSRAPVLISDHVAEALAERGITLIGNLCQCYLGVPIMVEERVIGVIAVQDYERPHAYDVNHVELLTTIASQAAIAIKNAHLYEAIQQELSERKRTEEALRESQGFLSDLIENSASVIYVKDLMGRYELINKKYEEVTGLQRELVIGRTDEELLPGETGRDFRAADVRVMESGVAQEIEETIQDATGVRFFISNKFPLRDKNNEIKGTCGISTEITARKRAEDALRASETSYRGLFDAVGEAIYILDREGRFRDVNLGAANMYGYNREQLIGKTPADVAAPGKNDLALTVQLIQRAFEGEPQQFEFWGVRANGEIFPKDVRAYKGYYFGQDVVIALARDITDQKMLQERLEEMVAERTQQLRQSEMLSASIINFLPDATLVIDSAGKIIAWNRAIEEMTGVKAAAMLGRDNYAYALPFYGVRRPILIDMALHPYPEAEGNYADMVRDGDSIFAAIASLVNLQGRQVYLTGKACTLRDAQGNITGAIESIRDVTTERRAVEAQTVRLRYEAGLANYSRALLETGEDDVIVPAALNQLLLATDSSRVYIFENYNDPQLGLYAQMQYEVCAAGIEPQIVNDEVRLLPYSRMALLYERMMNQMHYGGLVEDLPLADRQVLEPQDIISLLALPIYVEGTWVGFVGFDDCVHRREWLEEDRRLLQMAAEMLRAYLERKKNEQVIRAHEIYLQNLVTDLSAAKAEAEEHSRVAEAASQAKSIFLGNMSHELRTPLNAILGFSELLSRNPNITSSQLESLNTINQSGEHLLEIINDILEITRIETGRGTLKEEDFDFHKLLNSLQNLFQLQARNKGLQLSFAYDADVIPRLVRTDRVKLRQVLINLLGNAIKYTEIGQVSLRVYNRQESDTDWLDFAVEDSGMGISEEEMPLLFMPFDQTSSGRESMHGTGLGLAICHAYVKTLGGEISAESQLGRGSIFRFSIPCQRLSQQSALTVESDNQFRQVIGLYPDTQAADGKPYRLLVVEDVPANRQLLVKMLLDFGAFPAGSGKVGNGFEVREAHNGQEAVEIWNLWKPHLIWMDLRMPVMNGLEAMQKIHESAGGKQTIIIALTASAFEDNRLQAIAQGFDGYVRKPVRGYEVAEVLESQLGVRFIYAEQPDDLAQAADIQNDAFILPPELSDAWLSEMKQALAQGDLRWLRALAQQAGAHDPEIGARLGRLIDSFDLDAVAKLLSIQ